MKYTRTALGLLTRQYRSVLKKCWLINVGLFALGAAGVMVPNEAEAITDAELDALMTPVAAGTGTLTMSRSNATEAANYTWGDSNASTFNGTPNGTGMIRFNVGGETKYYKYTYTASGASHGHTTVGHGEGIVGGYFYNAAGTTTGSPGALYGPFITDLSDVVADFINNSYTNGGPYAGGGMAFRSMGFADGKRLSANFIGGYSSSGGGIGNFIADTTTIPMTANFIGNTSYAAAGNGGAIGLNSGNTLTPIIAANVSFIGNYSKYKGGAIGATLSNSTINGHFIANMAETNLGGAIAGGMKDSTITGHFIANSAGSTGGAISGSIKNSTINGNFISNRAGTSGGAIFGYSSSSDRNNAAIFNGDFIDNSAGNGNGGAIVNTGTITRIGSANEQHTFSGNYAQASDASRGGAIYNNGSGANITDIFADFTGNHVTSSSTYAQGGAIYNGASAKITNITGNFEGNYAKATDYARGGAINNEGGTINIYDSSFYNNYVDGKNTTQGASANTHGGAIVNVSSGNITISAVNKNVVFSNNQNLNYTGNDYYDDILNDGATLNIGAAINKSVTFGGRIYGSVAGASGHILNIGTGTNYGGEYNFNNQISGENVTLGTSGQAAIVNFGSQAQANNTTTYGKFNDIYLTNNAAGSHISTINDHIDANTVTGLTLNQGLGFGLDVKADNTSDTIAIGSASGDNKTITIDAINEYGTFTDGTYTYPVLSGAGASSVTLGLSSALSNGTATTTGLLADMLWSDPAKYSYQKASTSGSTLTYTRERYEDALRLLNTAEGTGFEDKTFTADTATNVYTSNVAAGETKNTVTVNGKKANGDTAKIDLNGNNGFELADATSELNLNDLEIVGGDDYTAQLSNAGATLNITNSVLKGADIINTAGNLNILHSDVYTKINNAGTMVSDPTTYYAQVNNSGTFSTTDDTFYGITDGAIVNTGTLTVNNGTFTRNQNATGSGGALNNSGTTTLTVTDSIFKNNSATGDGGAVYHNGSALNNRFYNTSFINNSVAAGQHGGAIYADNDLLIDASNDYVSKFSGNKAGTESEAVYVASGKKLSLRTSNGGTIQFDDKVNGASDYTLYIGGSLSGAGGGNGVVFNNTVTGATVEVVNNGIAKLGSDDVFAGDKLNLEGGRVDMRNGATGTMSLDTLNRTATSTMALDASLNSGLADNITATTHSGTGTIKINNINLVNTKYANNVDEIAVNVTTDAALKDKIELADDILSHIDGAMNYYTSVEYDDETGNIVFSDKLVNQSTLDAALNNNYYTKSQVDSTKAAGQPIAEGSSVLSAGLVHQAGEETITGTKTFATAGTTVGNVTTNNTVVVDGSSITMNEVVTDTSDPEPVVSTNPKITLNGATGAADFTGNTTIGGNLGVTGDTTLTGGLSVTGATILSATSGLQFGTGSGVQNVNGIATTIGTAGSGGTASNEKLATELAVANALTGYVSAVAEGSTNGTVAVTKNGISTDVAVHGLGSAAYADTSAFATSAQGNLANSALQSVVINGTTLDHDNNSITLNGSNLALTSYTKGSSSADIAAGDTINAAFGKVENRLDNINNNMFSKTNIKNSHENGSANTVYSTGYINGELDIVGATPSEGSYSAVKGINSGVARTADINAFAGGMTPEKAGQARAEAIALGWSESGDSWSNSAIVNGGTILSKSGWGAQTYVDVVYDTHKEGDQTVEDKITFTLNANATAVDNKGADDKNMRSSIYDTVKSGFHMGTGDNADKWTNDYLDDSTTYYNDKQKKAIQDALEQRIVTENTLDLTNQVNDNYDKDHITVAEKAQLQNYFASVSLESSDIQNLGAANDKVYKKFVDGGSVLNTINPDDTTANNLVRLDAVIGKIESAGVVQNNKTIGENLKALGTAVGDTSQSTIYTAANTPLADSIRTLANLIGKEGSFDFSQKSIAQTLADMPSVDQSSLVHTTGNEKISGVKSFLDVVNANSGLRVNKETGDVQVVGMTWDAKNYTGADAVVVDEKTITFELLAGDVEKNGATREDVYNKIIGEFHETSVGSGKYTNNMLSKITINSEPATEFTGAQVTAIESKLQADIVSEGAQLNVLPVEEKTYAPTFTVDNGNGNTWTAGTLNVEGRTTLSSTYGLTFDGTNIATSISNSITGDGSASALATTSAVASYVGKGKLSFTVNGAAVTGEFGANDSGNTTINLGEDFVKYGDVTPTAAITKHGSTDTLIDTTHDVKSNLASLANYSNAILSGTQAFSGIKLGDNAPITAWAKAINDGVTGETPVQPVDTKLVTEKAVVDYVGALGSLTTTNKGTVVDAINEVKSTVTNNYYTKDQINDINGSVTGGANLVHRTGNESIAGNKSFGGDVSVGGTFGVTGATTLGGTLGVSGKTTLSAAQGLSFGEETTTAKSIVTSISGASENALVTESAVSNYVKDGSLTLTINGDTKTAFTANQSANLEIDLGDYVTKAQGTDNKNKVLFVNNAGNVALSQVTSDMLAGDIGEGKLSSDVLSKLNLANTALQKTNVDNSTIEYDTNLNQLKVKTITNANIGNGSIDITKLAPITGNSLVITDSAGKLTTSDVNLADLANLHGLSDVLASKLDKAGGDMTGDITFSTGKGIKLGANAPVTDVATSTIGATPSTSTLVTEKAVTNYVGDATIQMRINGSNVGTTFTTNQSGNTVTVDLGNYVTQTQDVTTAGGKVLTVNATSGNVEATLISDGMLEGNISEEHLEQDVQDKLALAESALQVDDIEEGATKGTISVRGADISVHGLGTAAYENVAAFASATHGHNSNEIAHMTDYSRTTDGSTLITGDIEATDSLNVAVAKLENGLGGKQDRLTPGDGIQISGNTISAVAVNYTAGSGLSLNDHEFSIATGGVTNAMLQGNIDQGKISGLVHDLGTKLDTETFNARTINTKPLNDNVTLSGADIALTGYQKAATATAVTQGDTVNMAIGKLEKALEGQQTLTAGENITIENGRINATDTTYSVADGGGLAQSGTVFSLATGGITNDHINANAAIATSKLALNTGTANTTIYYDEEGHFANGQLTGAQIAQGTIAATNLTSAVQSALSKAGSALQEGDITTGDHNGEIKFGTTNVSVYGLGSAAYTDSGAYALASHNHTSEDVTSLKNYVKSASGALAATDSLNTALSKLEKGLDSKQIKLSAASDSGIYINQETGEIRATGAGGGAYYYAAIDGGLSLDDETHEFSIAKNGVTNAMLKGGITRAKLDQDEVQASLDLADSALQEANITEGDVAGHIKVGTKSVKVHGLADVATSGVLAATSVTEDDAHKFVTNNQINTWNNKQDAISDLTTIRNNATAGKSASDILDQKASTWDSKLSSVSLSQGSTSGTIALNVDGTVTQVKVKDLGTAAYHAEEDFASASHSHGSNNVTSLSGYSKAAMYSALREDDTLNVALGKLEKGLESKQNTLQAGSNISIVGNVISALDHDTTYTAPEAGGLVISGTEISIAPGGVTNDMLAGNISETNLSSAVQVKLNNAASALKAEDITKGSTNGTINVKGTDIEVKGLTNVAFGGNLSADKITDTGTTKKLVTQNQISTWNNKLDASTFNTRTVNDKALSTDIVLDGADIALSSEYVKANAYTAVAAGDTIDTAVGKLEKGLEGKQDTITDLDTIISNATKGKDAYNTLASKSTSWDNKVDSVSLAQGSANGTVTLTVNGTDVTQVAVKGLQSAAYHDAGDFAPISHQHVASEINKMTGYSKATSTTYAAINANDTLNEAIGKLEYALDTKQIKLTQGTGITIDQTTGVISATGGGAAYTALANGGLDLADNAFFIKQGGVTNDMLAGSIDQGKISGLSDALLNKVNITRTINSKPLNDDITLGGGDIAMTGYVKPTTVETAYIQQTDTINQAIGKLEKALEFNQPITAGKHIEIVDGKINATYTGGTNINISEDGVISATGSAAPYIAAENGGLSLNTTNNAFSIAEKGVTSAMLNDELQAAVSAAGTALQKADITTGSNKGTISVDGAEVAVNLEAVATGGNLAATKVTTDDDHLFVTNSDKSTWNSKIGEITATTATNNGSVALLIDEEKLEVAVKGLGTAAYHAEGDFAAAAHNHATSDITTLGGYGTDTSDGALDASDSLNVALHKLENNINKNKLTAGNNVTIGADGKINATDTKYSAAATGGLTKDANNAFSIASQGVTNTMLKDGAVNTDKLDSEINGLLDKAGSAIQTVKVNGSSLDATGNTVDITITSGTDAGAINVNGSKVEVSGLAAVATGGKLAADKVTTDATHRFVADTEIEAWNAKQSAISDLSEIRTNAGQGKDAYKMLVTDGKANAWNAKIGSVSADTGSDFGTIALTVDDVTTQVLVAGLGTAAAQNESYFARASHNHVASAIEAMTGYEIAEAYSAIAETDSLNTAIGKLEKGLDGKQIKLTQGTGINITEDGVISATGTGGAIYHAGVGLALNETTNTFSVSGVTNAMLGEAIAYDSLAAGVKASLDNADTALQKANIVEGTEVGTIGIQEGETITNVKVHGLADVAFGGNLAAANVTESTTRKFVSEDDKAGWDAKVASISTATGEGSNGKIAVTANGETTQVAVAGLKSAAFSETSAFAAAQHNHKSSEVNSLEGYVIANEAADVAETDTLNQALGKLQKSIKANKLTAGDNIDITNGVISATDTTYGVATNGGLALDANNKFSIASEGVTNAMLKGNITKAKLDSGVQASLGLADTALQAADITVGGTPGTISVKGGDVAVNGLKTVATTGAAADLTTDATHRLVTDTNINTWNAKQDAISDLENIRTNAGQGKDAYKMLVTDGKADEWDAKLSSISLTKGETNGTVALSVNGGAATEIAVKGLQSAAYHAEGDFALATHNHVSSEINKMTGYTKATAAEAISAGDTLNQAIGKLEYGLDTKQIKLTQGTGINITEDGVISVTGGGSGGATYHAGAGLALNDATNTFSIDTGGVTNNMLAGGIANNKLALNSGIAGNVLYYNASGVLTSGLLTGAQLAENADIAKGQLSAQVRNALTRAENAVRLDEITTGDNNGQIKFGTANVSVYGLGSAAFTNSNAYASAIHKHASSDVELMTGYAKYENATPISASDTLNVAIGKLEKGLDGKQRTLVQGSGITIDQTTGVISATGEGTTYTAGAGLALSSTNAFSIDTGGVTNEMLAGGISKGKLDDEVNGLLKKAGNALQAGDITSGDGAGTINVKGTDIKVKDLKTVATTGAAADLTTDNDHMFVTSDEKTTWNNKQNAISDLSDIRDNATAGKSASDTLATKANTWDNKVDSITTATGSGSNGKISVTANGVTTQVAVAGLKAGAFKEVDSAVTENSDKLITSGAVKSYVAGIDGNAIHQSGSENITGTKTFKAKQIFEKIIAEGSDAGTYTTELDGDTLKLNKNLESKITLDGKNGSATFTGIMNANGGINTTTLVVNNGMTVTGATLFNDNVTVGSTTNNRNLTVNGNLSTTGKATLSAEKGLSFGSGQEVTAIVNSIDTDSSENVLKKQLVTAQAVKAADAALSSRIDNVEDEVESQAATIAQHTTDIAANKTDIAANTAAIAAQAATISQHTTDIAQNKADIAQNKADIAAQGATIATHTSQIQNNTTAISGLDNRVTSLENTTADVSGVLDALGGEFNTQTHKWSANVTTDKGVTYGTLPVTDLVEAVSKVNSNIGTGEVLDRIENRTAIAENNGVSSNNSVNENISAVNATVGDLNKLNTELKNLTNGGSTVPATVVTALNNLDATLGTIHGLAAKRKAANAYKGNLAEGTTVEMHLSALDDAIGDRTTISNEKGSRGYEFSTETMYVADVLTDLASQIGTAEQLADAPNGVSKDKTVNQNIAAVSKAVGNVADLKDTYFLSETENLTDAVRVLDADMYKVAYTVDQTRNEVNSLRRKLRGGMASLSAMSALAPNSRADGKTQLSIGTGMYESSPAVAVGAFHWLTNNLMVNAGLAWGDASDAVYRVGLTYSF